MKKKVLVLSDHPFSFSGVGIQTRYFIEAILKSGKYQVMALGGAIKHADYRPVKTQEYGDDFVIHPVDGYGTQQMVRDMIHAHKFDAIWFMTDPRFWTWLWAIDQEIRANVPMIYYHVWDNYPYPKFNKPFYDSNDVIVTISKVTDDIVRTVSPEVECHYLPHAIDPKLFYPMDELEIQKARKANFKNIKDPVLVNDCSIAVFHGEPNPHDVKDPWVIEHWK